MKQEQMKRGILSVPETFELELRAEKLRIDLEPEQTLDKALERNALLLGYSASDGPVTWRNMAQPDLIISGETQPKTGAHYLGNVR